MLLAVTTLDPYPYFFGRNAYYNMTTGDTEDKDAGVVEEEEETAAGFEAGKCSRNCQVLL